MVTLKAVKQKFILLIVGVVFASSYFGLMPVSTASADGQDGSFISAQVSGQVLDHQLLFFLKRCFLLKDMDEVKSSEVSSWEWFKGGSTNSSISASNLETGAQNTTSVRGGMYKNAAVECREGSFIREAFGRFGFTDALDTFCRLGFTYNRDTGGNGKTVGGGSNTAACKNGAGGGESFDGSGSYAGQLSDLNKLLSSDSKYNTAKNALPPYAEYIRYYRTFMTWCDIGLTETYKDGAATDEDNLYKVAVVNKDGTVEYWLGQGKNGSRTDGSLAPVVAKATEGEASFTSMSCGDLAMALRPTAEGGKGLADAYATYMQGPGAEDAGDINDDEEEALETSCAIDGIGWIVCPVMTFIGRMNDAAFGFLEEVLGIRPGIITSESTQNAWAAFRDIANVMFVIAFMIIVYSQITSAGISNYGIKKMLPRIIVAAILVNASFIICALAVDLSNIVGSSVYSLLKDSIAADIGSEITTTAWEDSMGSILAAAATGIGVILLVVALFMAPTVLLAFALIILILIARQALVILLIVVAPLAFVAYLLPNTEDWFKKWKKAFTVTLMVYPIVGLVFGASTLASQVLVDVAQSGEEDESLLMLIALGVLAVPLFAVPAILKGSLSAAGSIGAKLSGLADKTQGASSRQLRDKAKGYAGDAKNKWNMAAANGKLPYAAGMTRRRMKRDFLRSSRDSEAKRAESTYTTGLLEGSSEEALKLQRAAGGGAAGASGAAVRAAARATQQGHKQYDEDVSAHKTTMTGLDHNQLMKVMTDKTQSSERRAAAAGTIMARDYRAGHLEALQAAGQAGRAGDDEHIGDIQKQMAHDMSDKPFALGDQAAGQLKIGTYGKVQPPVTNEDGSVYQPPQLGDIDNEMIQRVESKLSPATLAKMNPDELNLIMKHAKAGGIQGKGLANLQSAIIEARRDDTLKGFIKPEASEKFDELLLMTPQSTQDAAASSYGPGI